MTTPSIIFSLSDCKRTYIDQKIAAAEQEHIKARLQANLQHKTARLAHSTPVPVEQAYVAKQDRTVAPFKGDQLRTICSYLKRVHRYQDYMLFVVGTNMGLRYSDLCKLRFSDFMNSAGQFFDEIPPRLETKTANRKRKSNRHIYINNAVREVITLYLELNDCCVNDFLFPSCRDRSKPITYSYMNKQIKRIAYEAGVEGKFGTHSLRKTFGYQYMKTHPNDPNALYKLQKIFDHASPETTLAYIGITAEDIREVYMNLDSSSDPATKQPAILEDALPVLSNENPIQSNPLVLSHVTQEDIQRLISAKRSVPA